MTDELTVNRTTAKLWGFAARAYPRPRKPEECELVIEEGQLQWTLFYDTDYDGFFLRLRHPAMGLVGYRFIPSTRMVKQNLRMAVDGLYQHLEDMLPLFGGDGCRLNLHPSSLFYVGGV